MSRSGSGTYSLPAGQPVVNGTTIASATFNTLTSDISTEITDSLSRSAKGAMLAILQLHDGASATVPDLTWSGDSDTGLGHSAANTLDIIAGGTKVVEATASGLSAFTCISNISMSAAAPGGSSIRATATDAPTGIFGNRSAASTGTADVVIGSMTVRTAGNLVEFDSNAGGAVKLAIDFAGQIKWPSGPASTSTTPAPSAVTALSLNTNWTGTGTPAFWKDPCNVVHLKGILTNGGTSTGNILTTTPLPAGFRPGSARIYSTMTWDGAATTTQNIAVGTDGTIKCDGSQVIANTALVHLDGISFLAEA